MRWRLGAYISGGSVWRYCLNKGIGSYLSKRRLSEDKVNFALGTCAKNILGKNFRSVLQFLMIPCDIVVYNDKIMCHKCTKYNKKLW